MGNVSVSIRYSQRNHTISSLDAQDPSIRSVWTIPSVINTRPLTYVNFDEYVIIRPIDFISPKASLISPTYNTGMNLFISYQLSTKERTQREHVSPKSIQLGTLRVNEVVLVNEPEIPRGIWKLARIKEIKRSNDGERIH
ncbi:Pao retrotransposon peptidase family protein [Dirofilaria immitis]|nr:Pao retrotransposon peptidase family protein [Dirofilaria immitis]